MTSIQLSVKRYWVLGLSLCCFIGIDASSANTPSTAAISASSEATSDKPVLEWCLQHLPPRHHYLPGQAPSGPMVEMVQELANASGFTLKFSPPTPTSRCLHLLEQGKTDLMFGLLSTEKRQTMFLMAPFDEIRMTSFFLAPHSPQLQSQQDLRGRIIVLTKDRPYPAAFLKLLQELHMQIVWGKDVESALALLLYKQAELFAGPLHYTELELQKNPRFQTLKLAAWQLPQDVTQHSYLAMSRRSPHSALWPTIEAELKKMVAAKKTHFY